MNCCDWSQESCRYLHQLGSRPPIPEFLHIIQAALDPEGRKILLLSICIKIIYFLSAFSFLPWKVVEYLNFTESSRGGLGSVAGSPVQATFPLCRPDSSLMKWGCSWYHEAHWVFPMKRLKKPWASLLLLFLLIIFPVHCTLPILWLLCSTWHMDSSGWTHLENVLLVVSYTQS